MTYGKVLSKGKPYTTTEKSMDTWGAGDPEGKVLTDGVVGANYAGGGLYKDGVLYSPQQKPEITVDLGEATKCGAFRIHMSGYDFLDALKGQVKDKAEVLVSADGRNSPASACSTHNCAGKTCR